MTHNKIAAWLVLGFLAMASAPARAAELDHSIELGKRVGAITRKTDLAQLRTAYGPDKVKSVDLPGVEGDTIKGVIVLGGTDREMHVVWNPEKPEKEVLEVDLVGKAWSVAGGLKLGATLQEVETANGGPFKVYGFAWDMGGFALFDKGKLEGKVMVRFASTGPVSDDIMGDKEIPTGNKKLRAAKPVVEKLSVYLK
jgi:hypothetical protein